MLVQDICATSIIYVDAMNLFLAYACGYEEWVPGVPTLRSRDFGGDVDVVDMSSQCFDVVVCLVSSRFLYGLLVVNTPFWRCYFSDVRFLFTIKVVGEYPILVTNYLMALVSLTLGARQTSLPAGDVLLAEPVL